VAVDIAAGENHFKDAAPPSSDGTAQNGAWHRSAMCRCAQFGLGITNHAGESGPAANVAAAMSDSYGSAKRIGHGYAAVAGALAAAAKDGSEASPAAVMRAFEAQGITAGLTFECCPTSSRATRGWPDADWHQHPLAQLYRLRRQAEAKGDTETAAALPRVTISSDDPAVFNASLSQECALVADEMGLGAEALRALSYDAADACFLDAPGKARLRARLDNSWKEYDATVA